MNRKQRRALGRSGAKPAFGGAAAPPPDAVPGEMFGAALAFHRAGAFAEAERHYRRILKLFPAHAETNRMLGAALMAQAKAVEAIPYFERAVELRPDLPVAYEDLGRALGIEKVHVLPLGKDCAEFEQLLKESLASEKLVLIIARRPCVLAAKHIREYEKNPLARKEVAP